MTASVTKKGEGWGKNAAIPLWCIPNALSGKLEREWVDILDRLREKRHADQCDVSYFATKEEASLL